MLFCCALTSCRRETEAGVSTDLYPVDYGIGYQIRRPNTEFTPLRDATRRDIDGLVASHVGSVNGT